jgi:hypothetical protein
MPTVNPRITVTVTPSVAAVLAELSEVSGQSQSSHVAELLEASLPVLQRVVLTIRAAKDVQQDARDNIVAGLERAQAKAEKQLDLLIEGWDEASAPLLAQAESIRRRAKKRVFKDPPSLTGGLGAGKPKKRMPKRGRL